MPLQLCDDLGSKTHPIWNRFAVFATLLLLSILPLRHFVPQSQVDPNPSISRRYGVLINYRSGEFQGMSFLILSLTVFTTMSITGRRNICRSDDTEP